MLLALILLQAAAVPPPDIELFVHAEARSVEIEQSGEARLEVRAGPDGGRNLVDVKVTPSGGARTLRDVKVDVHAEARISDPQQNPPAPETSTPQ